MKEQIEFETGQLLGNLWKNLSYNQYRESVELFTKRAIANNFDLEWLRGKRVLDAGCGSGRYSVAMASHGAEEVIAVDISEAGLKEAAKRTVDIPNIKYQQASVLDLPFDDASFDFVWCAGVVHVTFDMDRGLDELVRVLKPGGKIFFLVYGAGGLRWIGIKSVRAICNLLGQEYLQNAITEAGLPANNRKNYMDDLFIPVQRLCDWDSFRNSLEIRGLTNIDRWEGNTFDHEANPKAQYDDMVKMLQIAKGAVAIAKTAEQLYYSRLFEEIAQSYVSACKQALEDQSLSDSVRYDIVIGQGNHRVVAVKA